MGKRRFIDSAIVRAIFTRCDLIFQLILTDHHRQGGERHDKFLFRSVGFLHCDVKVAATAARVHIGDFKRPGSDIGLVYLIAVLFNDDAGIGSGDTANNWRIAAHTFRQHRRIGGQLNTGKRHAVEDTVER